MTTTTILNAIADPKLFGPWFKDPNSWSAWRSFLATLFGLPLSETNLATYRQCTGRTEPPIAASTEAWLVCGRRAGKSFNLALVAVYLALFYDYRRYLQPGERGTIMVIARDRKQSRVIFGYIRALLTRIPLLAQQIQRETADTFHLSGSISIEIQTASFQSVRGYTVVAALLDELAFWPTDDSVNPDFEVINALRPAMATIPNAMLLCGSSPYAKRGALHDAYKRHYGNEGDPVLIWKASTRTMNPTVPQFVVDQAMGRDASNARAEFLAEFRSDLESFISRETVEACVERGVLERPPGAGVKYLSFTDPSGGSNDSMVGCVGHLDGGMVVIDALREILAPFDPESATDELVQLFRHYGIGTTNGDAYSSAWCRTSFERRGMTYRHCELPRSALYLNLLPHLNSRTVRLLDNPKTVNQIANLERRTARGARDTIDHPRDQHDDLANSIAGLVFVTAQRARAPQLAWGSYAGGGAQVDWAGSDKRAWEEARRNVARGSAPCTLVFPPEPKPDYPGQFTSGRMNIPTRKY